MNCFEFETRSTEYLDGLLSVTQKKDSEKHLEKCASCRERSKRYRRILTEFQGLEHAAVPVRLRSDTLQSVQESLPISSKLAQLLASWGRMPWLPKTLIQTFFIASLVIISVGIIPEIRFIYEKQTQKRLDGSQLENLAHEFRQTGQPTARVATAPDLARSDSEENEGFEGEYESEDDSATPSTLKAGRGEIWRFILRSESPREYRTKVLELFKTLGLPVENKELQGIEVPGGIQFDFFVEREKIGSVKDGLAHLAKGVSESIGLPQGIDAFTWYKNRSKKPLPDGKTRVILWLSQI